MKYRLLIATAVGSLLLAGCGSSNQEMSEEEITADDGAAAAASLIDAKPDIVTSMSMVYSDFKNNSLAAEEKYGGKTVSLTGFFLQVDNENDGYKVIMVAPASSDMVYLMFNNSYLSTLADFKRGDLIQAKCDGFFKYGTSPAFQNCAQIEKVKTGEMSADIFYDDLVAKENPYLK